MNNVINAVNKDSVIKACKKRAKEILKTHPNKELTLMQCLELAAKEMKCSSWYELRTNRKNNLVIDNVKEDYLKEKVNSLQIWERLIDKYFKQDYDTLHFEIRDNVVEIKARKYGLIETIIEQYSYKMINEVLLYLNIDIDNYGWLSMSTYNIQTMPVYSFNREKQYYDVIVVKRDEFEIKKNTKKQTVINSKNIIKAEKKVTFVEKLKQVGFKDNNIQDIEEKFGHKNIFIAGVTGSGKSKTAEIIVNGLKERGFNILTIEDNNDNESFEKTMLNATKSSLDYIFIPEARQEHTVYWLNKIIQKGYKIITTIHANNIDCIYTRLKSLGFTKFDCNESMTNNLFMYQEMIALLCNECKEKEFSFKKVVKNTAFMSYINKYEKHEMAEENMYKRSNNAMSICKNPRCHHGLEGRKIIAETYNIYDNTNNNYYKNIQNHDRYIKYYLLNNEEKIKIAPLTRLQEGKVNDYLKNMSLDCQSSKFNLVLNGQVEL